jgi:hypothetical protein
LLGRGQHHFTSLIIRADIAAAGTAEVSVAESKVEAPFAVASKAVAGSTAAVAEGSMGAVVVDSTAVVVDAANPA